MTDPRGEKGPPRTRLLVFIALLGAMALAVVVQLVRLTVFVRAREGGEAVTLPEVERGSILDRRGRILAVTTRYEVVTAWTPDVKDAAAAAGLLAPALGMAPADVATALEGPPRYAVIKRRTSEQESAAVKAFIDAGMLPGVALRSEYGRLYPQGRMASQVVGWVGADNVPLGGIEYSLNEALAPQPVGTSTDTVYGDQVFLTIDMDIQAIADRVARAALEANKADSLTVLVMDAPTGDILAWTSLPDFDPNALHRGEARASPPPNRPLAVAYEPGSVFKVFTLSGLLDMGVISAGDRFDCTGTYVRTTAGGETIRIRDIASHGSVTPQQVIEFSCNAGAAYASDRASAADFHSMLVRFGFGRQTGLPLPGETGGILRAPADWSGRSKATIAIGQEVAVSAVQVLAAASALANGGMLLKPHIVKKIASAQGAVVKEFAREPLWEAVSPDSAASMLSWMETATLPRGTARRAAVPGVRVSAKTGTAQVAAPGTGAYSDKDFIASLLGIFPTDQPRWIVYVVMTNPRGQSYYGSQVAAPVFHDVAAAIVDEAGLAREGTVTGVIPPSLAAPAAKPVLVGSPMPDLAGTPKKLLLPLLLRTDIAVTISGSGWVARQSPAPGTVLKRGDAIVLELK